MTNWKSTTHHGLSTVSVADRKDEFLLAEPQSLCDACYLYEMYGSTVAFSRWEFWSSSVVILIDDLMWRLF